MCFLNENDSFAYFAILGKLSSVLSFTLVFQGFKFLSILVGFFQGTGRAYLTKTRRKLPEECISDFEVTCDLLQKILFLVHLFINWP